MYTILCSCQDKSGLFFLRGESCCCLSCRGFLPPFPLTDHKAHLCGGRTGELRWEKEKAILGETGKGFCNLSSCTSLFFVLFRGLACFYTVHVFVLLVRNCWKHLQKTILFGRVFARSCSLRLLLSPLEKLSPPAAIVCQFNLVSN